VALNDIETVYQQRSSIACGAAAAVNVLRVFGTISVDNSKENAAAEDTAFKRTRTTKVADWLGSTPQKVMKYVMECLDEAGAKFDVFLTEDAVADYKSMDGLVNVSMYSSLRKTLAKRGDLQTKSSFTDDDVIVRFLDIGGNVTGHFVVQTNFDQKCQFLDSGRPGLRERKLIKDSFEAFLEATAYKKYKCTDINVGLTVLA